MTREVKDSGFGIRDSAVLVFSDLEAWKISHKLVLSIYRQTKNFPKDELYGLTSQIRRAAVSITSNIAEGFGRFNNKEKMQFYRIAAGSLMEIQNQLLIARDIGYINKDDFKEIVDQSNSSIRLINGLIRSTERKLNPESRIPNPKREIRDPSSQNPESRIPNPNLKVLQPKMEVR